MTIDFQPLESEASQKEIPAEAPAKREPLLQRHIARIGARVAETLGGGLGDVLQLTQSLLSKGVEKVTGRKFPQKLDITETILGIPTTRKFKEVEKMGFGEYLEPQSAVEKFGDEIAQTATGLVAMKVPVKLALRGAALGATFKEIGKKFNLPTWAQTGLDLTGNVLGSAKFGNINKYKEALYTSTKESLPENAITDASKLKQSLEDYKKNLSTGLKNVPQKQKVVNIIDELLGKIENNTVGVKDLWDSKKDIYQYLGPNYSEISGYKEVLKKVNNDLRHTLYGYGKQNPEFVKNLKKADEFYGNVAEFEKNVSFISKIRDAEKFGAALALLNGNFIQMAKILGAGKGIEFLHNLIKKPVVVKFYGKALKAAAMQNKISALNSVRKLNDIIVKEGQKNQDIDFIAD